ncbi:MAG: hypothetical protein H0V74_04300 [Chloroflexi bacterium]|nr:hypothetical protein [Chloroflexota bacterium]
MPVYDYVCPACSHRFEVIHGVHADGPKTCPACGSGPLRKGMTAPTVHFKGSGWAKKDRRPARTGSTSSADSAGSDGKTEDRTDMGVTAGGAAREEKGQPTETKKPSDKGSTGGGSTDDVGGGKASGGKTSGDKTSGDKTSASPSTPVD